MQAYERLLEYIKWPSASDENSEQCPSTPIQSAFGNALVKEMKDLGIKDAEIDRNGYVYGTIPPSEGYENAPVIGFISHMDVVSVVPYENIKPRIVEYTGEDIVINEGLGIKLSESEFPFLANCMGKHLIVTDGTTLLGADDKNGIAEIMTLAQELLCDGNLKHGKIKIGFTPDEEIGRGADKFDIEKFGARWAYTLDGGAFGTVDYETFNAASAEVSFKGVSIHPGAGKDKLINACILAMEYNLMLPAMERPENTEKYEGYIMLKDMKGDSENAQLRYIIRDHDSEKLDDKIGFMKKAANEIKKLYGENSCHIDVAYEYKNMGSVIKDNMHLIENAYECIKELGYEPISEPMRGGTDGADLSFKGLPCPNLGMGGYNYHGRMELSCIEEMDLVVELLKKLCVKYASFKCN